MSADSTGPNAVVIRPPFDPVARPFHTLTDEQWETAWEHPLRHTIEALVTAHATGATRVVVLLPTTAMSGGAQYAHVAAAAEAIRVLVKSTARQWGAEGITVNAVAVDPIEFGIDTAAAGPTSIAPPALRHADARSMVSFLCSEASGDITGQTLVVDGGVWM
ncbi:MAG: SDR family oxidoreductase [Ilumatobacteraceae bacterium]